METALLLGLVAVTCVVATGAYYTWLNYTAIESVQVKVHYLENELRATKAQIRVAQSLADKAKQGSSEPKVKSAIPRQTRRNSQ